MLNCKPTLESELHQTDFVQSSTIHELPNDFIHESPKGFSYEVEDYKRNVLAFWLLHHANYVYSTDRVRTIWGFYNSKKREYYAPINAKKCGDQVNISRTTPYTAMQLKLTPLEYALYSTS